VLEMPDRRFAVPQTPSNMRCLHGPNQNSVFVPSVYVVMPIREETTYVWFEALSHTGGVENRL
jgi:hypothetical protein